ncbi:hypothetical protein AB1Y20_023150 [Prymnesium parvum]|uniref:Uncharacterized protein n=1 Tax=Prymnesium parvum TaxID=97485 RepID=A0AB34JG59_PRYPA
MRAEYSKRLLQFTSSLGYESFLVEEVCGLRMDCRNILHVPRDHLSALMASPVMTLATASWRVMSVNASSIIEYAYPCCASSSQCCPSTSGVASAKKAKYEHAGCCDEKSVTAWLRSTHRSTLDGSRNLPLSPMLYRRIMS